MVPERIAGPAGDLVVRDDEVTHVLILGARLQIVLVDVRCGETGRGKHGEQPVDTGLDQVDARRLERLQEPGGKADRDDVLVPRLEPATRGEANGPRIGKRL